MSTIKVITLINWIFISIYGAWVLWALLQTVNPHNDAGGKEMETAIKGLGIFLILALVALNLLPYQWTKIVALILSLLLLLFVWLFIKN